MKDLEDQIGHIIIVEQPWKLSELFLLDCTLEDVSGRLTSFPPCESSTETSKRGLALRGVVCLVVLPVKTCKTE